MINVGFAEPGRLIVLPTAIGVMTLLVEGVMRPSVSVVIVGPGHGHRRIGKRGLRRARLGSNITYNELGWLQPRIEAGGFRDVIPKGKLLYRAPRAVFNI